MCSYLSLKAVLRYASQHGLLLWSMHEHQLSTGKATAYKYDRAQDVLCSMSASWHQACNELDAPETTITKISKVLPRAAAV